MSRILIIEDEPFLRKNMKELLLKQGYEVFTASCKDEAVQYILNGKAIDLYLVDVWLPDGDGFEICERIRQHTTSPVIFLTACDDEESVVKGLDIGADDYITKPFRTAEVISRIRANLRRQIFEKQEEILRSEEIVLVEAEQRVYKKNVDLGLSPVEYQLLCVLMKHAGIIVKRDILLEKLWDVSGNYVEDNTLSVHMSRLRSKVGQEYIETIRGFGYRFTKSVSRGFAQEERV